MPNSHFPYPHLQTHPQKPHVLIAAPPSSGFRLSHKLLHAIRKRDEAFFEASRLMHSMGLLEKKLNKLEFYSHNLKPDLEECTNVNVVSSSTSTFLGVSF
ncbi:hypothetical protein DEO72_LG8g2311 [Vigna unguiculata]|uniref:Uncharacterized protein n=1 Tax=Vigna unguiculata TaxID=3917 RepID=A0A4D6MS52_VIGUN|nr:hypothetical protein DEO72_LG8g2311 [Vigna unguiculata]